jgi:hypothetical protein
VVVAVRPRCSGVLSDGPAGAWREVLSGQEGSFEGGGPVDQLVGELGVAVFERL